MNNDTKKEIVMSFFSRFDNVKLDDCIVKDQISTFGEITGIEIRAYYKGAILVIDNDGPTIDLSKINTLYPLKDIEFNRYLETIQAISRAFGRFLVPGELNFVGQNWFDMMQSWVNLK